MRGFRSIAEGQLGRTIWCRQRTSRLAQEICCCRYHPHALQQDHHNISGVGPASPGKGGGRGQRRPEPGPTGVMATVTVATQGCWASADERQRMGRELEP